MKEGTKMEFRKKLLYLVESPDEEDDDNTSLDWYDIGMMIVIVASIVPLAFKHSTPFTMEVTKSVFSSAENDPMEYIVKKFYPNKNAYPEQIRKLRLLIGEIETLKDAKTIIDNYKKDYQQYLSDVPAYVMENDEDGFYARLGFANISEKALTIEYRFSYTSDGGMVQKSFPVPMTEDTIIALIDKLESKLTMEAFTSEQRALMTPKLRNYIKERWLYLQNMRQFSI